MPALRQLIYVLFFTACILSFSSLDQWWHLKSGDVMLKRCEVLKADPFSHTLNGANWVAHSWGGAVAMKVMVRLGGFGLLQVIKSLLFLSFLVLSVRLAVKRGAQNGLPLLLLVLAAVAFTCRVVVARPKVVTVLAVVIQEWLLYRFSDEKDKRYLVALPLLYLLWANMHGGFVVTLAFLGVHLVGSLIDTIWAKEKLTSSIHLLAALVASAAAGLLNPRGIELFIYPFQYLEGKSFPQYIVEWQPMWPPQSSLIQLAAIVLLSWILLRRCYHSAERRWEDILVCGLAILLSLRFQRNEYLLAATLVPAAASSIPDWPRFHWLKAKEENKSPYWVIVPIVLLSLWAIFVGPQAGWTSWNKDLYPEATKYLRNNRHGPNLIHDFGVAGFLIHELWPDYRVFIDGRNDFYHREGLFDEYLQLFGKTEDVQRILKKRNCQTAVVGNKSALYSTLKRLNWKEVFRSKRAVVLISPEQN